MTKVRRSANSRSGTRKASTVADDGREDGSAQKANQSPTVSSSAPSRPADATADEAPKKAQVIKADQVMDNQSSSQAGETAQTTVSRGAYPARCAESAELVSNAKLAEVLISIEQGCPLEVAAYKSMILPETLEAARGLCPNTRMLIAQAQATYKAEMFSRLLTNKDWKSQLSLLQGKYSGDIDSKGEDHGFDEQNEDAYARLNQLLADAQGDDQA